MLKERTREIPESGADEIHPAMNAPRVLGEVRGAADADALIAADERRIAAQSDSDAQRVVLAKERLTNTGRKAAEQVLAATPQQRAADMIEKAERYLGPGATAEQLDHVANHVQAFARAAADLLMRGDFHGLDSAITTFWWGVRDADKLAPPKPPQPPRKIVPPAGGRTIAVGSFGAILAKIRALS